MEEKIGTGILIAGGALLAYWLYSALIPAPQVAVIRGGQPAREVVVNGARRRNWQGNGVPHNRLTTGAHRYPGVMYE
jgi:hypothetical protein